MRALVRYAPQASMRWTVISAVMVVLNGVLPVAFVLATGRLIGAVPAAVRSGAGSKDASWLLVLVGVTAVVFVLQQTVTPVRENAVWQLAWYIDIGLQQRVMRATTAPVGIAHLEDPKTLDRIAVARGLDGQMTPGMAIVGVANMTTRYLSGTGSMLILCSYRWWLGLVLAAASILNSARGRREFTSVASVVYGLAGTFRRADYIREVALKPDAAKETRVFGLRDFIGDRYRTDWLSAMTEVWRSRRRSTVVFLVMLAVSVATRSLAFLYIGAGGANGRISLTLTATLLQAVQGIMAFGNITQDDLMIAQGTTALPAALSLERDIAANVAVTGGGRGDVGARPAESIRFEAVSFRYPSTDLDVLRGLDLEIEAGRSLGVVGLNGAGKTTLIKLLTRMYDPTEGRILVDGVDLREFDPPQWQRRVAAIFQDFIRYDLPARDNVGFGHLPLLRDSSALGRAAARAGASTIIDELPAQWDTVLNRQYTDGADLSGGEWQRIALARALLAVEGGAKVLILDEPTANLDVRSEADLYDRFLDITHGLTSIVISHRFSTVRRAERIVVLEGGAVIESGSHDDLVIANGRYAAMYRIQAARFEAEGDGEVA